MVKGCEKAPSANMRQPFSAEAQIGMAPFRRANKEHRLPSSLLYEGHNACSCLDASSLWRPCEAKMSFDLDVLFKHRG